MFNPRRAGGASGCDSLGVVMIRSKTRSETVRARGLASSWWSACSPEALQAHAQAPPIDLGGPSFIKPARP